MGAGGVKNLSVGICDGAPSTARSSLACNDKNAFLLLNNLNDINCGHVRNVLCSTFSFGQYIHKICLDLMSTNCRYSNGY